MPDNQIEEVKSKVDIVSIIGEHVRLTKSGSNFRGLCPFHQEKTPSFMVSEELQIYKCFGCFPAGQFVKTPFGYHKIEEVIKDEYVISGKGNIKKVLTPMKRKYKGKLVTVKTGGLSEPVIMTTDHVVYVVGGEPLYKNHYKYLSKRLNFYQKYSSEEKKEKTLKYFPIQKEKAGNLAKGMSLLYPIDKTIRDLDNLDLSQYVTKKWPNHGKKPLIPELEIRVDNDFLKLIGYYIAEGSNHRAYIRFSLSSDEEDFAKEILKIAKKIFNIDGATFRKLKQHGLEVTICNSILADIFANLCGKGAENKHIPFIFQQLPPKKQIVILNAIYKGDGFEPKLNERHKNKRHSITTVSRTLAEQLTDILLRSEFFPSRNTEREKYDKKKVHHKIAFTISWALNPSASKLHHIYETNEGSFYWILPIREVKQERFSGDVYNLMIEDDHSYIANNFAVANCGEGGDVFTFLEKYDGMEFGEALRYLAEKTGVKLTNFTGSDTSEKQTLYEINTLAAKFYNFLLVSHPIGKIAMNYLKEDRGISLDSIKTFNIGFAPGNKNALSDFLINKKKMKLKDLQQAGIIFVSKAGRVYDRFEGRIIFPISDHRGNVIALAGRLLPPGKENVGKYINSPETPIYHKSSSLYGLSITKDFIKKEGFAVVVEGEIDLISSFQIGIKNVVAIKGSAFTADQARLLGRYTKEVVLALDSDFAGVEASLRGIKILDKEDFEIRVVELGIYKDPDEAARGNSEFYREKISESVTIWDYLINASLKRFDKDTASGKAKIGKFLTPILSDIDNKIVQDHYIKKLAKLLEVSPASVASEVEKAPQNEDKSQVSQYPSIPISSSKTIREVREETLINLLLRQKPEILKDERVVNIIEIPILRRLIQELKPDDHGKSLPPELFGRFTDIVMGVEVEPDKEIKSEINNLYRLLSLESLKAKYKSAKNEKEMASFQKQYKDFDSDTFERIIA